MPGIAEVVEAVATELEAAWQPADPDALVRREYKEAELDGLVGRRVWVFARGEGQVEKAARGKDVWEYRVGVVIAERYTETGAIPLEWIDERTAWVRDTIVARLGDEKRRPTLQSGGFARACWPQRADTMEGVGEDGQRFEKAFVRLVELDYRRLA